MRKTTKRKPARQVTIRLPADLADKYDLEARRLNVSRTDVIVKRLRLYEAPTLGDVAGDLIGSLHGPGDLNTNPKYMEGYGLTNAQIARLKRARRAAG